MKTLRQRSQNNDQGFIYVASRESSYYEYALLSAQSLKDFYADSHVTLFTHEKFLDKRSDIFDRIIVDIPIHYRAKMWCMARTPYQQTIYIDADSQVCHPDVSKMFKFLNSCDLFCGGDLIQHVGAWEWAHMDVDRKHRVQYHGSMWGYHKTPENLDLMQTWFDEYVKQVSTPWPYKGVYLDAWQKFDMFTLWKITSGLFDEFSRFKKLNIKILPRRWNAAFGEFPENLDGPPVIVQVPKTSINFGVNGKNENYKLTQRSIGDPVIEYN